MSRSWRSSFRNTWRWVRRMVTRCLRRRRQHWTLCTRPRTKQHPTSTTLMWILTRLCLLAVLQRKTMRVKLTKLPRHIQSGNSPIWFLLITCWEISSVSFLNNGGGQEWIWDTPVSIDWTLCRRHFISCTLSQTRHLLNDNKKIYWALSALEGSCWLTGLA